MLAQKEMVTLMIAVVVVASLGFAFAEEAKGSGNALAGAVDALVCKIDFTVAILNAYQTNANATNLSSIIAALGKDKTQLQTFVSVGNVSVVREFIKNTLDVDLKSARTGVEDIRSTIHKTLSKEQKQSLKDAYKKSQEAFSACHRTGLKNLGDKRVEEFTKILDQHSAIADRLAAKGLDVMGMKKVVDDAKAQVVTPLKDALAKANNSEEIQAVVRKYCLFNGCKNGINFHFAAKFEAEKLSATLAYVKAKNLSVSDDQLSRVQSALVPARGLLAEMGTAPYADEGKSVKKSIQSVYGDLKTVRVKATVKAQGAAKETVKAQEPRKEVTNNEQKR